MIERLVDWCARSEALAPARARARSDFFGDEEPGTVDYPGDTGEISSRERRFLGWFVFHFQLPDGRHPGELAARALLKEPELGPVLKAIRQVRYVIAVVASVIPGRGFRLELEDEEFEVVSRTLSRIVEKGGTLCAHIFPDRHGRWLPGPGWLTLPIQFGPGIRSNLKEFQLSPVKMERFLQKRLRSGRESPETECPHDATLAEAVARMSAAATAEGRENLVLEPEEWANMVLSHMSTNDLMGFAREIVRRTGDLRSVEEVNRWLALAANIWNTTPQPHRGGRTANELDRAQEARAAGLADPAGSATKQGTAGGGRNIPRSR